MLDPFEDIPLQNADLMGYWQNSEKHDHLGHGGVCDRQGDPDHPAYHTWFPLINTPGHPEFPSTHSVTSGAAAAVLSRYACLKICMRTQILLDIAMIMLT